MEGLSGGNLVLAGETRIVNDAELENPAGNGKDQEVKKRFGENS